MSDPLSDRDDKPDISLHPPTLFFAALIIGYILRVFAGGWLPIPELLGEAVGGIVLIIAVLLFVASVSAFAESGETLRPATPSDQLLTAGAYQYSRNPIYLAMVLFCVGFGLATQNLWVILAGGAAGAVVNFFVIPEEEAYLDRKFGVDYREYKERVRRWV